MATSDEPGKSEFGKNVIRGGAQAAGWFLAWLMFKKKDERTKEQIDEDWKNSGCRSCIGKMVIITFLIIIWAQITECNERKAREKFFEIESTE